MRSQNEPDQFPISNLVSVVMMMVVTTVLVLIICSVDPAFSTLSSKRSLHDDYQSSHFAKRSRSIRGPDPDNIAPVT